MVDSAPMEIGLNAALVSILGSDPSILCISSPKKSSADALPYGRFDPVSHRTMDEGLRELAEAQTGLRPGYVEQLYTFGDRGRTPAAGDMMPHVVSVGYLALTRLETDTEGDKTPTDSNVEWRNWYGYFPWEDWRSGRPKILDTVIIPEMEEWALQREDGSHPVRGLSPASRVKIAFGLDGARWDDELVLDRYELIYSAGLIEEAVVDGRIAKTKTAVQLGRSMAHDHRRILATAMARLRSKLKYRPVVFELLPNSFTLTEIQQTVECIFGRAVHKQNFRRLVEKADLVEPTGETKLSTGGRPAALFRFRSEILQERPAPGLRVGRS